MNSQYGMLLSERPGMTFCPGDELWAVCQVQIQGVILSSGFPYQLFKVMVIYQVVEVMVKAWVRGSGLESWCRCLPVPSWEVKIPPYEEMSFGKLSQVTVHVFSDWFHQQHWACSRHTSRVSVIPSTSL